mgnify:CR=1 FL=1
MEKNFAYINFWKKQKKWKNKRKLPKIKQTNEWMGKIWFRFRPFDHHHHYYYMEWLNLYTNYHVKVYVMIRWCWIECIYMIDHGVWTLYYHCVDMSTHSCFYFLLLDRMIERARCMHHHHHHMSGLVYLYL